MCEDVVSLMGCVGFEDLKSIGYLKALGKKYEVVPHRNTYDIIVYFSYFF